MGVDIFLRPRTMCAIAAAALISAAALDEERQAIRLDTLSRTTVRAKGGSLSFNTIQRARVRHARGDG